jgi:LCP family protein required for cell wall assembly
MSEERHRRARSEGQPHRVQRSDPERQRAPEPMITPGAEPDGRQGPSAVHERPYRIYRSAPRGLRSRLRGQQEPLGPRAGLTDSALGGRAPTPDGGRGWWALPWRGPRRGPLTPRRALAVLVGAVCAWCLLSAVLFFVSASQRTGALPAGATSQLTAAGPMLTSANTVLVIGLDSRPRTGPGSKEPGSNYSERVANTDTIMLWRIGGGVSRRLSIPRDTLVNIPGLGAAKINAAWSFGGPALALEVIKRLTGVQINHLIVVDLANFPRFINDVGGVTVHNGHRICATLFGGPRDGGFDFNLAPGWHHLDGLQAELFARVRDNPCDLAYTDITRERHQQEILNAIKSQLLTVHTFLHLPWVAWDAPSVLQTDMGGLTLMQMFIAAEIAGSPRPRVLSETPSVYNGEDVLLPSQANIRADVRYLLHG